MGESRISFIYQLVRTKKSRRNEFLKSIIRLFDVDHVWGDVGYYKFLAELLAMLPYKYQDEVLWVLYHIHVIVSVSGAQLMDSISNLTATSFGITFMIKALFTVI